MVQVWSATTDEGHTFGAVTGLERAGPLACQTVAVVAGLVFRVAVVADRQLVGC